MKALPVLWSLLICSFVSHAQEAASKSDSTSIVETALNYVEGFYNSDGERMEKALHPMLAKRTFLPSAEGQRLRFVDMSALMLVQNTRNSHRYLKDKGDISKMRRDIVILDINNNSASVKAYMEDWIDYMHLFKVDGDWKIVNVLWELN